jgi:hypothetical protein
MANARPRSDRPAGRGDHTRRGGGPKALADSLRKVTGQALGQRSHAERSLILDWPSVAGGDVARMCTPQGLSFRHRDRRLDGTLTLRVASGQATRLQHLEPQLIERINGYLGYRAVARLRLLHGGTPAAGGPQAPTTEPDAGAAQSPGVDNAAPSGETISDPALRAALIRLGRAVKPTS